ncbi:EamA family transporter [Candidatus Micrarchaeota archaeon]|nr:EamA family transporter [Candidatus Micrarchaeota archaeon]
MLTYLIPFAWINRKKISGPIVENAGAAVAYFIGFFGFATALSLGVVSLAAPVANLFPLVAVGLAVVVYGEKLERHQWAGLVLAAAALAGLSV